MTTLKQLIDSVADQFPDPECARLDAEILAGHGLAKPRSWIKAFADDELSAEQISNLQHLYERRIAGEPVAYILGEWEFFSIPLRVSPATLIPRPETELMVERCIELLKDSTAPKILDMGTGTGAIAIALAKNLPSSQVVALDVSSEALEVAKKNAMSNRADVKFRLSDWFEAVTEDEYFDLIVSNPPYVAEDDPHLEQGDLRFEPRSALTAGNDEFADLKTIITDSVQYLKSTGVLIVEHGYSQETMVQKLFRKAGLNSVQTHRDYSGNARFTEGFVG